MMLFGKKCLLVAIFCVLYSNVQSRSVLKHVLTENNNPLENVVVRLVETEDSFHPRRSKRDASDCLMDELSFTMKVGGEDTVLTLRVNSQIDMSKPVYISTDGEIRPKVLPSLDYMRCYQDLERNAAIGVKCRDEVGGNCHYRLEGTFSSGLGIYAIYPSEDGESLSPDGTNRSITEYHIIQEVNITADFRGDFIVVDSDDGRDDSDELLPKQPNRQKRAVSTYNIELLIVTDSLVYDFWYDLATAATPATKDAEAKQSIHQYFATVFNGIDLRYKNVIETDVAFNVLYAGLLIVTDPAVSNWTSANSSPNPNNPDRPWVDSGVALASFTTWRQQQSTLPQNDHAMLFTKHELIRNNSTAVAGLAYVSQTCKDLGTSICEDLFDSIALQIAAHELGHSISVISRRGNMALPSQVEFLLPREKQQEPEYCLGASHDEEGVPQNSCLFSDRYIMAASTGSTNAANAVHPWYFSNCSVDYFRDYIAILDAASNNCLLSEGPEYNATALDQYLQQLPGQFYDMDTQCRYTLGSSDSYMCRGFYNATQYVGICSKIYCSIPGTNLCKSMIPARGTSCGNQKWCIDGECVFDSIAPSVPDYCPMGDQPGILANNLTCTNAAIQEPYRCYDDYYSKRCCQSCGDIYIAAHTGCEYGDRLPACVAGNCDIYNEYSRTVTCCGSCLVFTTPESPSTTTTALSTTQASTTVTTQAVTTTTAQVTTTTTTHVATTTTAQATTTITTQAATTPTALATTTIAPETTTMTAQTTTTTQAATTTAALATTTTAPATTTTTAVETTSIASTTTQQSGISCTIDGTSYSAGQSNPAKICQICDPSKSLTSFVLAETYCLIDGVCYAVGTFGSNVECSVCAPWVNTSTWTVSPQALVEVTQGRVLCQNLCIYYGESASLLNYGCTYATFISGIGYAYPLFRDLCLVPNTATIGALNCASMGSAYTNRLMKFCSYRSLLDLMSASNDPVACP